jgi:hypothetical protein
MHIRRHSRSVPLHAASLLAGFGAGASLALLLTPRSGRESKQWIGDKTRKGMKGLRVGSEAAQQTLRGWTSKGRKRTLGAIEVGKQAYREATVWPE